VAPYDHGEDQAAGGTADAARAADVPKGDPAVREASRQGEQEVRRFDDAPRSPALFLSLFPLPLYPLTRARTPAWPDRRRGDWPHGERERGEDRAERYPRSGNVVERCADDVHRVGWASPSRRPS
jgi:hypothetical protein